MSLAVKTPARPATKTPAPDPILRVLEDIWYALTLITVPTPPPLTVPAPVVNFQPPDISLPEIRVEPAPWPPELLDAIGAIRDVTRIPRDPGPGASVLEALGRIEKLLSQQKQSEGRTLGLVPRPPQLAADGSQTVTTQNPVQVKDSPLTPLGFTQFTNLAVITTITPAPAGAVYAHCNCEAQPIRYRDDGVNPTPTSGMLLQPNAFLFYIGTLSALRFIGAAAGAVLNVSYYS